MPEANKANQLKSLVSGSGQEQPSGESKALDRAQELKSLVGAKPEDDQGFIGDFTQGATAAVENVATMFSGDPKLRGIEQERTEVPESFAGRAGQVATESGMAAVPGGAAASRVRRASEGAGRIRGALQNVTADIGQSYARSPGRFVATETTLGAVAGAGGLQAERMFPESQAARFMGEIAGGSLPSASTATLRGAGKATASAARSAPARAVGRGLDRATNFPGMNLAKAGARKGADYVQDIKSTMDEMTTVSGAKRRSQARIDRATQDREEAVRSMEGDIIPESGLTPAQKTGDAGLLSLHRAYVESQDLGNLEAEQLANVNRRIKDFVTREFKGDPEDFARQVEDRMEASTVYLDNELRRAAVRTNDRLKNMVPSGGKETDRIARDTERANNIARQEVDKALDRANTIERNLFNKVDQSAPVGTSQTRQRYQEIAADIPQAQMEDLPVEAKRLIGKKGKLGRTTNIRELRGLQSKLRETARNARSGDTPNYNKARIADSLANSITEDIANSASADNAEAVQAAVEFSRQKNQTFSQGTVGKMLGHVRTGEDVIRPGVTLDRSLGLSGSRAREAFDDIVQATDTPEVNQAMSEFVFSDFVRKAAPEGTLNVNQARSYLNNNAELLTRMPGIRQEIESAIQAGDIEALKSTRRKKFMSSNPNRGNATLFLREPPDQALDKVFEQRNPTNAMKSLMNLADKDKSGRAIDGLKAATTQWLLDKASRGQGRDASGQQFVSGASLQDIMGSTRHRAALSTLFGKAEERRLNQVLNTARRMDLSRQAKPAKEGVIGDQPGQIMNVLAGVTGAALGRQTAELTGGGTVQTPGIVASSFRKMSSAGVANPAEKLIVDALNDEELFKSVLRGGDKGGKLKGELPEQAKRRLNAWVAATLSHLDEDKTQENGNGTTTE